MVRSKHGTLVAGLFLASLLTAAVNASPTHQKQEGNWFARGNSLLATAGALERQAGESLQQAKALRDFVKRTRPKIGGFDENAKDTVQDALGQLIETSRVLQNGGSVMRQRAEQLLLDATMMYQSGMVTRWSNWISQTQPMQLADGHGGRAHVMATQAHNTQVRSVNPKMMSLLPSPEISRASNMSLEIARLAGQSPPQDLHVSSFALSRDRHYFAHIEIDRTDTEQGDVVINQLQSWRFILSTLDGEPVSGATIEYSGHMPGHVHGLPTQPRVTDEIASGVYRVSGVKFQMRGWWVIELSISDRNTENAANPDSVRFNLTL